MKSVVTSNRTVAGVFMLFLVFSIQVIGQEPTPRASLPPAPAPQGIPAPGPVTDKPYAPQAILPGGIVVPLYQPDSKHLKADKVREAEKYGMSKAVPGRINSIVNIHNPSIEV